MKNEFNPLVSIIIPVFNGEKYLHEAIDSAIAQSYDNIEIIVINDGSTDKTEKIALSYGDKIRYYAKENGGVSTALNKGIENMRGEYFSWLSHDDLYHSCKIELCIEAINDCRDRIVYADYEVIDIDGNLQGTTDFKKQFRYVDLECGTSAVLSAVLNGCTMLIPKSIFDKKGMFDESLRTTQDYEFFYRVLRGQRIKFINKPLTKYRTHKNQQTYINPKTFDEGNSLWIGIFESLSDNEIQMLAGSPRIFWNEKVDMLMNTFFGGALLYAQEKYETCVSALRSAKISVIMPFYNRLSLMPSTIKSVLDQTYTNWELILANDGSEDDISEIEAIANSDKRVKIINLPHRGVSATRNSAIEASTGEFIALLDSDDLWEPEKLEKQLSYMLDDGYAFSYTSFDQKYLNGDLFDHYDVKAYGGDVFFLSIYKWFVCTSTVMFERKVLGEMRFSEHIHLGEDICLWFYFLWRYKGGAVPEFLNTNRIQNETATLNMDKRRNAVYTVIGYVLENYNYEECMPYVGLLVDKFRELFSDDNQNESTSNNKQINDISIQPQDYLLRFLIAKKRYGLKSIVKKLIKKVFKR